MRNIELAANKTPLFWGVIIFLTALATAVVFYACAPAAHAPNYWLAMVDIIMMELILGGQAIFTLLATSGMGAKGAAPPAISISRSTTLGLFLLVGGTASIVFAFLSPDRSYDLTFRVILAVKWVALLIIMAAMWTVGQESASTIAIREESRKGRLLINDRLREAFTQLRNTPISPEAKAIWQSTLDDFEATNNRVRSWISARPEDLDPNSRIDRLVADLHQQVAGLPSQVNDQIASLRKIAVTLQGIAREVRGSATSAAIGIA